MAEANQRTRLEAAQARVAALRVETTALPERSARRIELAEKVEEARGLEKLEESKVAELRRAEVDELARHEPSDTSVPRRHWWQSSFALFTIVVGPCIAFNLASWALDFVYWSKFGARWQWYVAAMPLIVNGLRVARGAWRRRKGG